MPYITNAQREALNWRDLSFAVERVCAVDGCDQAAAVQQLRQAIADGNLRVSWADLPARYVEEPIFDSQEPPTSVWWWLKHAKFDLDAIAVPDEDGPELKGLVEDDWCLAPLYLGNVSSSYFGNVSSAVFDWIEERLETRQDRLGKVIENRIRFRPLLVWKPHIDAIWGWPVRASSPEKPAGLPVRKSAPDSRIIEVCKDVYAAHRDDPPNINEAWKLVSSQLDGTSREKIRTVLRRPEFKKLRRPVGIRKPRGG